MSTAAIILLIVLIPLTAFNLYILVLRKRKKAATRAYQQVFSELELKAAAEMEKRNLDLDEKQAFLNDAGQGILISFNGESGMMAVTLKDAFHVMPASDVKGCHVRYDEANGKYSRIRVEIETSGMPIIFVFGTGEWRPKSALGEMIMEEAREFCNRIRTHCGLAA